MKKLFSMILFICSFLSGNAYSEITYNKKKLNYEFSCDKLNFGFEITKSSNLDKITVWAPSMGSAYNLPESIVAVKSDQNFKAIHRFFDMNTTKFEQNAKKYNLLSKYMLFDVTGDLSQIRLVKAYYNVPNQSLNIINKAAEYLVTEYDDLKYVDKLYETFFVKDELTTESEPLWVDEIKCKFK